MWPARKPCGNRAPPYASGRPTFAQDALRGDACPCDACAAPSHATIAAGTSVSSSRPLASYRLVRQGDLENDSVPRRHCTLLTTTSCSPGPLAERRNGELHRIAQTSRQDWLIKHCCHRIHGWNAHCPCGPRPPLLHRVSARCPNPRRLREAACFGRSLSPCNARLLPERPMRGGNRPRLRAGHRARAEEATAVSAYTRNAPDALRVPDPSWASTAPKVLTPRCST